MPLGVGHPRAGLGLGIVTTPTLNLRRYLYWLTMADSKAKRPPVELKRFGKRLSQLNELDDEKRGVGYKTCQILEVLLVILLIFLAWGLLSLPVIFYYIDIQEVSQ